MNIKSLFKFPRRKEGKQLEGSDVDHQLSSGRKEGKATFEVREDGVSWQYENLIVEKDGATSYVVYILREGKEGKWDTKIDTVECRVPNVVLMLELLTSLTRGKNPVFTSVAEGRPPNVV